MIPPGDRLLSFGPVHHLFAYYFQDPIELRKVDDGQAPTEFDNAYFCFVDDPFFETPEIPFAWERVAEMRARAVEASGDKVHVVCDVAQRLPSGLETATQPPEPIVLVNQVCWLSSFFEGSQPKNRPDWPESRPCPAAMFSASLMFPGLFLGPAETFF